MQTVLSRCISENRKRSETLTNSDFKKPFFTPLSEENVYEVARIESESIDCPWSLDLLKKEIGVDDFVVLYIGGRVVGYGSYYVTGGEANVNNIAIDKPYRRKGYANLIMQKLIDKAKSEKLTAMTLEVSHLNVVAIGLYEKFGFKTEGRRKNYYPDNSDALIMWLRF